MKFNQSGKLNIMIISIIVVLQILIAAALYFFVFAKNDTKIKPIKPEKAVSKDAKIEATDSEKDAKSKEAKDYLKEYAIYTANDIVINPKDNPESYLVLSVALEYQLKDANLPVELKNKDLLIKDKILTYFSSKTKEELQLIENREKFKSDLKKTINSLLIEGRVTNVLFSQYVMQ